MDCVRNPRLNRYMLRSWGMNSFIFQTTKYYPNYSPYLPPPPILQAFLAKDSGPFGCQDYSRAHEQGLPKAPVSVENYSTFPLHQCSLIVSHHSLFYIIFIIIFPLFCIIFPLFCIISLCLCGIHSEDDLPSWVLWYSGPSIICTLIIQPACSLVLVWQTNKQTNNACIGVSICHCQLNFPVTCTTWKFENSTLWPKVVWWWCNFIIANRTRVTWPAHIPG